jgi:hypothetical protein
MSAISLRLHAATVAADRTAGGEAFAMGMAGALTGALALDIGQRNMQQQGRPWPRNGTAAATLKQSWERIGQRLRAELGEDLYSSWFARMEAERLDAGKLVASVPTRFLRNWIEAHYADRLRRICEVELGPLDCVSIRVRVRRHAGAHRRTGQAQRARRRRPARRRGSPAGRWRLPAPAAPHRTAARRSIMASPSRPSWSGAPTHSPAAPPAGGRRQAGPALELQPAVTSIPRRARARPTCSTPSRGASARPAPTSRCSISPRSASCTISSPP